MLDKCKMVIFSDLHYAPKTPINSGSKLIKFALPILEKIIDKINNEIKPDVVVNLGDLIEDFNDHDKDIESLKFVWNEFSKINTRFYSVIGNHDLRSMNSIKEVEQIMGYEHSTFSKDINGYHLIFLGTEKDEELKVQIFSKEDMDWLKKDLANNKLPCLVFLHYGLAEDDMRGNKWFEECPEKALLGNRRDLKEVLKKDENVIAVFSGHQHWTKKLEEDNINYYVIGSLTERDDDKEVPDGVYFEVELDGRKINVEEKHIKLDIEKETQKEAE